MTICYKWDWGNTLYIKTDAEQKPRQLTAVLANPGGRVQYQLSCGTVSSWHYDFELSEEVNTLAKITTE